MIYNNNNKEKYNSKNKKKYLEGNFGNYQLNYLTI